MKSVVHDDDDLDADGSEMLLKDSILGMLIKQKKQNKQLLSSCRNLWDFWSTIA